MVLKTATYIRSSYLDRGGSGRMDSSRVYCLTRLECYRARRTHLYSGKAVGSTRRKRGEASSAAGFHFYGFSAALNPSIPSSFFLTFLLLSFPCSQWQAVKKFWSREVSPFLNWLLRSRKCHGMQQHQHLTDFFAGLVPQSLILCCSKVSIDGFRDSKRV